MAVTTNSALSRHKYRLAFALLNRAAGNIGSVATVGATIGSLWFLLYLVSRPGGVGDLSDDLNFSLAIPIAAFGIAAVISVALYFTASGLIYRAIIRLGSVPRNNSPRNPDQAVPIESAKPTSYSTEATLFIGLSLVSIAYILSATVQVVTTRPQRLSDWTWLVAVAIVVIAASLTTIGLRYRTGTERPIRDAGITRDSIIDSIRAFLLNVPHRVHYNKWRDSLKKIIAIVIASFFWIAPTAIICLVLSRPIEAEFTKHLPIYIEAITLSSLIVLAGASNYRIATSGPIWMAVATFMLTGLLFVLAPVFLSALPFQLLDQGDRDARFLLLEKEVTLFKTIHSRCNSVKITANTESSFHIFSSIGSEYTIRCNKDHYVRISKGLLGPEIGDLAPRFITK